MRTVKVVIIGNSGVGKTSLRGQYVSGHFSTAFRSTIGTDFITKTLPHHSKPDESVTLQIWDTAGQERFSSLSSAFFRGADAVILIFDVNQPQTMRALDRWWSEFCACAPLSEEETEEYCLVVVGNKTDLAPSSKGHAVSEGAALSFIDELVPPSGSPSSSLATPEDEGDWMPRHVLDGVPSGSDGEVVAHDNGTLDSDTGSPVDIILVDETHSTVADADNCVSADRENSMPAFIIPPRTPSIDLYSQHHKHPSKARSRASQFSLAPFGTVSSNHTGFTTFHTPASSFSDGHEPFHSALSSPLARSRSPSTSPPFHNQRSYRVLSASAMSTSTSIAPTITPARYANDNNLPTLAQTELPRPPRGPKLFFTSAKTGTGVSEVFDYVARRVVMRWEWEEAHMSASNLVGNYSTVRLGDALTGEKRAFLSACCSS